MDLLTYIQADATALAELIRKKEVTPKEVIDASFQQLEKVNSLLQAVTHHRKERVLQESEQHSFFTVMRSEEHTSELQSRFDLVCRLLLEKKNELYNTNTHSEVHDHE